MLSMNVGVNEAMHIHTHTCMHVRMHTHTYTHIRTYTLTHKHTHTYTHAFMHTHIHTHACTHTHMHHCIKFHRPVCLRGFDLSNVVCVQKLKIRDYINDESLSTKVTGEGFATDYLA